MANELENQNNKTVDREAEKSVISSLFQLPEKISMVATILKGTEFSSDVFNTLYSALVDINDKGEDINVVTVRNYLIGKGANNNYTDVQFLKDISMYTPDPTQVMSFVNIVKEKSLLRDALKACAEINSECNTGKTDINTIVTDAQDKFFSIFKKQEQNDLVEYKKVLSDVLIKIGKVYKAEDGITGVRTKYKKLDDVTAGFQNSDFIVIAARPGVGKTAFSLNLAYNMIKGGYNVAFFSLEMSRQQLVTRILSMESTITSSKLRSGRLNSGDMDKLLNSVNLMDNVKYAKGDMYIDDTAGIDILELKNKCKQLKIKGKLDIVFIDYLQLLNTTKVDKNNRTQYVGEISRDLKALAKDLDVPVVALAQTRRPSDVKENNRRPQLEDLRESGSIEQDADIVMFLHDPHKNDEENGDIKEIQLLISKHRNGPTRDLYYRFNGSIMTYDEFDKSNDRYIPAKKDEEEVNEQDAQQENE